MAPGPDRPAQLGIERLDGIGGVQNSSDLSGKSIKRDDLGPGAPPALADGRVFAAPGALLEGTERGLAGFGVNRPVDVLERRRNRLSILPGDKIEAVAQQVDDAGLYRGLREDSRDRLGEALQAVDDSDQHVLDAAVFQLVRDAQPELGALVLFEPQPQDFLAAVGTHAERDMDSLIAYQSFVADLDSQRVEKDQRVDRFQRPRLPGSHFLQHRVGYRADQIGRDLDPVELTQMADNLAGAHDAGVHRDDLVIKPRKAALVSGDQLRIETGLAVARHRQLDPTGIGNDRLLAVAISPIARLLARQMMVHLGVENPFGQGLLQIVKQPIGRQGSSRIGAGQQLIEHGIRDVRFFASRHGWAPSLPSCPTPHEIPDSPTEGAIGFATQQELLEVVAGWLSVGQAVTLLADRFYGTPEMICWCCDRGWDYRLRLKSNLIARLGATRTTTGALALSGGHYFENIILTGKRITTNLGIIRDPGHTEPWIIAMSAKPGYLTTLGYAARWGIEPLFSDFKSRGFGLQQTHLRYPDRLSRLILVMALALYWAVSTGMWAHPNNPAPAEKNTRTASRPSSPAEDFPGSPVASGAPSSFSSNASRSQSSGDV